MKMSLTLSKRNLIREVLFRPLGSTEPHISIYLPRIEKYYSKELRNHDLIHLLGDAYYLLTKNYSDKEVEKIKEAINASDELKIIDRTENALAFFYKEGFIKMLELPIEVSKKVVVATSFHIKPIIEIEQMASAYYFVSLHKDKINVYEGTTWTLERVYQAKIDDYLKDETRQIDKKSVDSFFNRFLQAFGKNFTKDERPIIIDGVSFVKNLFVQKTGIKKTRLISCKNTGDIKEKVFNSLKTYFQSYIPEILDDFESYRGSDRIISNLSLGIEMANKGKIGKLIVASDVAQWGQRFSNGEIILNRNQKNSFDDDLLDDMAEAVLRNGGEVYCLPKHLVPFTENFSAIIR